MNRAHPMRSGLLVAIIWVIIQAAIWTAVVVASMFLSLVLVVLIGSTLDPTNWKGR